MRKLNYLTHDQIEWFLLEAYTLLEETGIQIGSKEVNEKLAKSGECEVSDGWTKINRTYIQELLKGSPAKIMLSDRMGKKIVWGEGQEHTLAGVGVTNLHYWKPQDDEIVPFGQEEFRQAVLLGNSLPAYEVFSTPGIIQDAIDLPIDMLQVSEMLAFTTKPLMLLISDEQMADPALNMIQTVSEKIPFQSAIMYVNPISPLQIPHETIVRIEAAIKYDIPVVYSAYSMMGATSPIQPEAAFVMHLAEILAGLAVIQTLETGHPTALGMLPARFDMKAMVGFYDHSSFQMNLACAEIMDSLGIPHAGTSGSGNGWGADIGAVSELWFNHFSYSLSETGMMPFIGGLFDSMVFSPELVVYSNEIIEQIRAFRKGMGGNTPGIQEMISREMNYLMAEETLQEYMQFQPSDLAKSMSFEKWRTDKSSRREDLRIKTGEILQNPVIPDDSRQVLALCQNHIKNSFL